MKKLSRAELKNIKGGFMDDSGESANCRTGSCSVYDSSNGQTYNGTCATYLHPGPHPGSSPSSHCICWTSLGHYESTNNYTACTA